MEEASFYDLFLRFNRRILKILRHLKPPLAVMESHVLSDISDQPNLTARELVPRLQLDKSTLSRLIATLEDRGLVQTAPSSQDGRAKQLSITVRGAALLAEDSRTRNQQTELTVAPLPPERQEWLARALRIMADNLKAPQVNPRPDDHPVKREVRRLTRVMGFIGSDCMGTEQPSEVCQALHAVLSEGGSMALFDLKERLPYESTLVSRLVTSMEEQGLLVKQISARDRRFSDISLTEKGTEIARRNITEGDAFVLAACKSLSPDAIEELRAALAIFLAEEWTAPLHALGDMRVVELRSERDRQLARTFLVEELVRQNMHRRIPDRIFPSTSINFAFYLQSRLCGVCELRRRGEREAEIAQLCLSSELASDVLLERLIEETLRVAFSRRWLEEVSLSRTMQGADQLAKLSTREARDRIVFTRRQQH